MKCKIMSFIHNVIIHPICGIMWLLGFSKIPDWLHENIAPSEGPNSE